MFLVEQIWINSYVLINLTKDKDKYLLKKACSDKFHQALL